MFIVGLFLKTSRYAVRIHSTRSTDTPNAAIIFDRATFTIVESRTAMKVPIITAASTIHR